MKKELTEEELFELNSRTTGMGLWTQSNNFSNASMKVYEKSKLNTHGVANYLIGHSIELGLKAFVRTHSDVGRIVRIGHDLEKAIKVATSLGLSEFIQISKDERQAIKQLNFEYKSKELELPFTLRNIW